MTTEQLVRWKRLGIPFDDAYVRLAQIGDKMKADAEARKAAREAAVAKKTETVTETQRHIISVKWVDYDNNEKERRQTLSDKWVSLKIETNGFLKGDKIKIKIEEINGKSEIELAATKEKDDILIIKKAFKFDKKNANNTNRVVKVTAYYEDECIEGENILRENNGGIWGTKKNDTIKVVEDIKAVFADKRFEAFSVLIQVDKQDNKHIAYIDIKDLALILHNLSNDDDKVAVEIVANTINFTSKHEVQVRKSSDKLNEEVQKYIVEKSDTLIGLKKDAESRGTPTLKIIEMTRGCVTTLTDYGTFSLIIEDSKLPKDYWHSRLNEYIYEEYLALPKVIRPIITLHEIVGHGRPLILGITGDKNDDEAIRFENMLLRISGHSNIFRDGTKHGREERENKKVDNPEKRPNFR